MNRYEPWFHPIFAILAIAMTALTLMLAVGVPTSFTAADPDAMTLAVPQRMTTGAIEVDIIPVRIDVIGVRDTNVADRQTKPRG